jgi:SAM-dependent methyltransferase
MQVPNMEVSKALSQAYAKGAIASGMMDEEGIGKEYAEDFLAFLLRGSGKDDLKDARVLEIGAGTGYLLYRLKQLGADVLGLEPGPHGQDGSKRFGVKIMREFFPSWKIDGPFDLIVMYGVLEHTESVSEFLAGVLRLLKEGGRVAVSVPDCEPYLEAGDMSMLLSQHWSYYTGSTLRNSIKAFLRLEPRIEKSRFGGSLYAICRDRTFIPTITGSQLDAERQRARRYRSLVEKGINRFLAYLKQAVANGESVGIYVPGRAINALSHLRDQLDLRRMRFFDDNKLLHGTYFPGFNIPVEPRERLIEKPTERVLVMSRSFGSRIAKQLLPCLRSKGVTITTWEELFAP